MPRKYSKKKGGSPASKAVMNLVTESVIDAFMIVPLMKGGSPASNMAMSSVQQICNCSGNQSVPLPQLTSNLTNFYKTTGGTRSRSKTKKNKSKKGGTVPYYLVMKGLCNSCGNVKMISSFPKTGGSGWLATHNSRSASVMSPAQFQTFTKTGTHIPGGQNSSCILNGPMFK